MDDMRDSQVLILYTRESLFMFFMMVLIHYLVVLLMLKLYK